MKSYVTSIVEEISKCSKEVTVRMSAPDRQDDAISELKAKLEELWRKLDQEVRGKQSAGA